MSAPFTQQTLGIIAEMYAGRRDGGVYTHLSLGRIIDRLAARFARVLLSVPLQESGADETRDYRLQAPNIELVPQPYYRTSLGALRRLRAIGRAYAEVCRRADQVFVRGMPPAVGLLYAHAWRHGRRPCHWVVGNPIRLLRTHHRSGLLRDLASLAYACQDRLCMRWGRRWTGGAFICNGAELGQVFASPRTRVTVSTTLEEHEFYERTDTCQADPIRILFVGILRPEKGVQYLIEALAHLMTRRRCELTVVGASDQFSAYRRELEALAARLGLGDRVRWVGYVAYGPEMFRHLREADLLVLPTLSEGTPRVLVEARANSLPVIATSVGGIPTSVTDGEDGLLVPPKDPRAIAAAIDRLIADGTLRRSLIASGLQTARRLTVDRFVDLVMDTLAEGATEPGT